MNFLVRLLLIIFIFAQTAPSLISIIDEDFAIELTQDDQKAKEEKQYKTEFVFTENRTYDIFDIKNSNKFNNNYLMKKYTIFSSIDILPPEQV